MKYNNVPKTNLEVSEISFGCMSLDGNDAENSRLLHKAIDVGINYFDTADLYDKGQNEKTIGSAFKTKRESVIIASKVGNQWNADGTSWRWNPTKDYILKAIDKSLHRLQTDYIDIYQLHGGTIDDPIEETIEAFEILKQKGKIREYGISSIRPNVIRRFVSKSNIASNMIQYSLLDRRPEEAMLDLLREENVAVMVRGGLAKGLLVNKHPKEYLGHSAEDIEQVQSIMQDLAASQKSAAAQIALRYVLNNSAVTTTVVGFRNEDQLENVIQGFKNTQLGNVEYQTLRDQVKARMYETHR